MNTFLPILKNTLFSLTLLLCSSVFAEEHDDLETVFSDIYKDGGWGCDENGISISGHGSTPNKVQEYLNCLNSFLDKYRIKTIVDIGCGDFNLGKHLQLADRNYIGIDISQKYVNIAKERLAAYDDGVPVRERRKGQKSLFSGIDSSA